MVTCIYLSDFPTFLFTRIAISCIVAGIVIGLSILLARILPSRSPIGAITVILSNGIFPLGFIALSAYVMCSIKIGHFYVPPYRQLLLPYTLGVPIAVICGLLIGLLIYAGVRVWRGNNGSSPVRITIGATLLTLSQCGYLIL